MSVYKDKIDAVITDRGSDIVIRSNNINTDLDEWGDYTIDSYLERTIKAVKDNYRINYSIQASAGRIVSAESALIVQASENFDLREDKITFDGQTYNILQIQNLEMSNEVLAKVLQIAKV